MLDAFEPIAHALCEGPCAWSTPRELAESLGWSVYAIEECLCELINEGLVDIWPDAPGGPAVTLSSLAAARLGVTLVLTANSDIYKWSFDSASVMPRRPSRTAIERSERHDSNLRSVADPRPEDHAARIDRDERAERRLRSRKPLRVEDLPKPTILLTGHGLLEWDEQPRKRRHRLSCGDCTPGPGRKRRKLEFRSCRCGKYLRMRPFFLACPGCHGRPLSRSTACLRCGRWGWDDVMRKRRALVAKSIKRKVG